MVQRWAQELLGYTSVAVHRPNLMMCDVDALSRRYGNLTVAHICVSNILHDRNKRHQQKAYQQDDFISLQKSKINIEGIEIETCPIIPEHNILESEIFNPDNNLEDFSSTSAHFPKIPVLVTQPINFIERSDVIIKAPNNRNIAHSAFEITESRSHNILSIDDVTYSLQAWSKAHQPIDFQWEVQSIFSNKSLTKLRSFISISTADPFIYTWSQISDSRCTILDMHFVKKIMSILSCGYQIFKPLSST